MNRNEYIRRLDEALSGLDFSSRKEITDEFERHFDEGIADGRSEEEIAEELGSPEQAADDLRTLGKERDISDTFAEAASSLAEVIRKALSSGFSVSLSGRNAPKVYEGGCEAAVREVRILGRLASVDIDIQGGDSLNYTFREGMNLFVPNEVQFETEETEDSFLIRITRGHGDLFLTVPRCADRLDIRITNGDVTIRDQDLVSAVIENKSGDIEIFDTGLETLSVHSAGGDLSLADVNCSRMDIELLSGDIEMDACTGIINAGTLSGDIDIREHDGEEAVLSSKSGDIDLATAARVIRADSSSGDIDIRTLRSPAELSAATRSGDISLLLSGSDWQAVLQTTSGDIKNKTRLPVYKEGAKQYIGEGRGRVTARSVSGDIRLT